MALCIIVKKHLCHVNNKPFKVLLLHSLGCRRSVLSHPQMLPQDFPGWKSNPSGRLWLGSASLPDFYQCVKLLCDSKCTSPNTHVIQCTWPSTSTMTGWGAVRMPFTWTWHLLYACYKRHTCLYLCSCIGLLSGQSRACESSVLTLMLSSLNKLCVCIVFVALKIQKRKANIRSQIFAWATPPFFLCKYCGKATSGNVSDRASGGEEKSQEHPPSF